MRGGSELDLLCGCYRRLGETIRQAGKHQNMTNRAVCGKNRAKHYLPRHLCFSGRFCIRGFGLHKRRELLS